MAKAPAKGGGRSAAPAEPAPQVTMTPDLLQAMIAGAVATALQAVQPANVQPAAAIPVEDADNETDYQAEQARKRELAKVQDKVAADVLAHMIEPRFVEIFQWLAKSNGATDATMIRHLLRGALVGHRPAYREYLGEGGQSSRNLETLTERLTPQR